MSASATFAKAVLEWAESHRIWLTGVDTDDPLGWDDLIAAVAGERRCDETRPHVLRVADLLAELLLLEPIDAALLGLVVAFDRLPRVASLAKVATSHGHDLTTLLGIVAGAEPHDADQW